MQLNVATRCSRTHSRCEGAVPARPGQLPVQGPAAEPAVGQRFHVRLDVAGFHLVAFVIDAFARRIVGWRVSSSMRNDFVQQPDLGSVEGRAENDDHGILLATCARLEKQVKKED